VRLSNRASFFLVPALVLTAIVYLYSADWSVFSNAGIKGETFGDYKIVAGYLSCFQESDWLRSYIGLRECWQGYNYGPSSIFLVWLNSLSGLSPHSVAWTTLVIAIIVLCLLSWRTGSEDLSGRIFQGLLLVSSNLLLLYQRANLDVWIFIILYLAILTHKSSSPFFFLSLLFVTLMKFYTFPALIYYLAQLNLSSRLRTLLITFASVIVLPFFLQVVDLIPYNWFLSFGSFMPAIYLDFAIDEIEISQLSSFTRSFLGVLIFCLAIAPLYLLFTKNRALRLTKGFKIHIAMKEEFRLFALVFVPTFLLSTSYDYRLILLVPLIFMIDKSLYQDEERSRLRPILFVIVLFTFYLGSLFSAPYPYLQIGQFLGDLGLFTITLMVSYLLLGTVEVSRGWRRKEKRR